MGQAKSSTVRSPPHHQINGPDLISNLPPELLFKIFQSLSPSNRLQISLVSKSFLATESQFRNRLSLLAHSNISPFIPQLATRFQNVAKLTLKCNRKNVSINDNDLIEIVKFCPNLTRLKLRTTREITCFGVEFVAKNLKKLKKVSFGSLNFGVKGINAVLENSESLEEISVKRLRDLNAKNDENVVGTCLVAKKLKSICLKELYDGPSFVPLIIGCENLKILKIFRCSGNWDEFLETVAKSVSNLVEIHLERIQVSDNGLVAISKFKNLEILHIVKTPECSNIGVISVAKSCKLLRKLYIDGWKTNRIGDEGLISVAKSCLNLQELILVGVNVTVLSLELLGTNCKYLERLALCGSDSVGDKEINCVATKFLSLKKLCLKSCQMTDFGMEALANGCPKLAKFKVRKCGGVTYNGADLFRAIRVKVAVNLDVIERENTDLYLVESDENSGPGRSRSFKARLGLIVRRNLVSSTFKRWSSFGGSSSRNS